MTRNYGNMNTSVNLKLDEFYIVEAECCRTWPVALGFRLNPCGLCEEVPVTKNPLVVIREPLTPGGTIRLKARPPRLRNLNFLGVCGR
jgi:hypothetical protein